MHDVVTGNYLFMKRLTPLLIFILLFGAAAIYLPGLSKYLKLKHTETDLRQEMERLQSQIAQLERDEHLLKTDMTRLEQVVREELGLVKPGETIIRVVEQEPPQQSAVPAKDSSK